MQTSGDNRFDGKRNDMTALPAFLQEELQRLPIGCGIAWWERRLEQTPVFVFSAPPGYPVEGRVVAVHYLHAKLLEYPTVRTVLELPFQLSSIPPIKISLLLNPGDVDQRSLLIRLTKILRIELRAYEYGTFNYLTSFHSIWPEMYRINIRKILKLAPPPTHWREAVTHWIHTVYPHKQLSLSFAKSPPTEAQPSATAVSIAGTPASLSGEKLVDHSSQQVSQAIVHQSKEQPISLLPRTQLALQHLSPLTGLLWQTDKHGVPYCLIKVPQGVQFSNLSVILETPRQSYKSGLREAATVLPFSTQKAPGQPRMSNTYVFYLSSSDDWQLLVHLSQTSHVQLLGYSQDPTLKYLGSKSIDWSKSKRKAIQQLLNKTNPGTTASAQTKDEMVQHNLQQNEQARWKLPIDVRRSLSSPLMRAHIVTPDDREAIPRIYVKVPQGTRFEDVAVAFGPLNLYSYTGKWILSLAFFLQDANQQVMNVDCLSDPISEHHILHRLTTTTSVEMVAIADTPTFPVLGVKLLKWSPQKKDRAKVLFEYTRTVSSYGSYKRACAEYLKEHLQQCAFQVPFPKTAPYPATARYTVSIGGSQVQSHEESISLDGSLQEEFQVPLQASLVPAASQTRHTGSSPLVEKFFLLHRTGVHEEFTHTHTLSRRMFWRMLLALAAEKTLRKFVWSPEATHVIEEHRKLLTPSMLIPWLSSREHLWIEFTEPWETPVSPDMAALFIFSASEPMLYREFAQQVPMSSHALKALQRNLFAPEQRKVTFNIVNRAGAITWAISLNTDTHGPRHGAQGVWSAPAWYICPSIQCQLHTEGASTLCDTCAVTRTFVWTWLTAAWQSLLGLYREKPGDEHSLETIGVDHIERFSRAMPGPSGSDAIRHVDIEYRYRVVRHIDIADSPLPTEPKSAGQRGSWVEALSSIDPALVFYDEREIPLRTRILRHPRYSNYIERHGTNQVEVRPHIKHVPMRSDPKTMTRVTAKRYEIDMQQE